MVQTGDRAVIIPPFLFQLARYYQQFESQRRRFPQPSVSSQLDQLQPSLSHFHRLLALLADLSEQEPPIQLQRIVNALAIRAYIWSKLPLEGVSRQQTFLPGGLIEFEAQVFQEFLLAQAFEDSVRLQATEAFLLPYVNAIPASAFERRGFDRTLLHLQKTAMHDALLYEAVLLYDRLLLAEEARVHGRVLLLREELRRSLLRLTKLTELLPGFRRFFPTELQQSLQAFLIAP